MRLESSSRLPFWVKMGYGAAEGANALIWVFFYLFFLYFLTDVVGLDPAFAGLTLMIGVVWDAISDPIIGIASDRMKSKWGRRRPFFLAAALPFGLISWLLFTDFDLGPIGTKAYFILAVILYFTAFSCINVPQTAMAAEMTQDYDERTSLLSYRALWSQAFSLFGAALPLLLAGYFTGVLGSPRLGWSATAALFGLVAIPLVLVTWRATRGYELFPEETHVHLKDIPQVFNNIPFRYTLALFSFAIVAQNIMGAVLVYFMKYLMGFSDQQASTAFLILFAFSIVWIPVINILSKKKGKRWTYNLFMGLWALGQGAGMMVFARPEHMMVFYVLLFFISGGIVVTWQIGWSMISDVVEVDEFKTGHRREGLYFGIIAFAQKTASGVAIWMVGMVLSWIGYVPGAPQTESTLMGIRVVCAEGTTVFIILSAICAYLMPLTREKHRALLKAIRLKKEGMPFDKEGLEGIV